MKNTYTVTTEGRFGVTTEYTGTDFTEAKARFFELDAEKEITAHIFINDEMVF